MPPDDSNGIYSVPAGTIVSTGDTILPSQHNPWANDSASAISNRFSKDGRAPATGNWNINSFRLTNVGAPVDGGDAINKTYADGLLVQPSVDVASAATTDIGAATSQNVRITGSVTITSFGTAPAGTFRRLTFAAAPLLTYNATSLILPGAANIVTVAGDVAEFVSEGAGNWRCVGYISRPVGWEVVGGAPRVFSGVATVDWVGLSVYRSLRLKGFATPATDGANLQARTSTNNGSSFSAGGSDYTTTRIFHQGTTINGGTNTASAIALNNGETIGNIAANEGISIDISFEEFNQISFTRAFGHSFYLSTTSIFSQETIAAQRLASEANNALRVLFSSGNMSGNLTLWGLRG